MNPFGTPITDQTLKQMAKYQGKNITQEDRAREAMRLIHAEDKNINALQHVLTLKSTYGDGVTTLCLVYNGTGDTLQLVDKQDWSGYIYKEQPPSSFENGQWLAFLHAHPTSEARGTEAARVYRGKNVKGEVRDYMIAWSSPWGPDYKNSAYTEVRDEDHFSHYWSYIKGLLEKADKITVDETDENCTSTAGIGGVTSAEFIAILKHKFSPQP